MSIQIFELACLIAVQKLFLLLQCKYDIGISRAFSSHFTFVILLKSFQTNFPN